MASIATSHQKAIIDQKRAIRDSAMQSDRYRRLSEGLRAQHDANVENITPELMRSQNVANAVAQSRYATPNAGSFSEALQMNLRRAKARQGIVARGENAVRGQQLKDRLQAVRSTIGKRATLMQSQDNTLRNRIGLETLRSGLADQKATDTAGMWGGMAGMAARQWGGGFKDWLFGGSGMQSPVGGGAAIQGGYGPGGMYAGPAYEPVAGPPAP